MNRQSQTGMSSLDLLGDIPRGERILLKIFLRNPILTRAEFVEQVANLHERKKLSEKEIEEALLGLKERGWVDEDDENYTLKQQRKRGSRRG